MEFNNLFSSRLNAESITSAYRSFSAGIPSNNIKEFKEPHLSQDIVDLLSGHEKIKEVVESLNKIELIPKSTEECLEYLDTQAQLADKHMGSFEGLVLSLSNTYNSLDKTLRSRYWPAITNKVDTQHVREFLVVLSYSIYKAFVYAQKNNAVRVENHSIVWEVEHKSYRDYIADLKTNSQESRDDETSDQDSDTVDEMQPCFNTRITEVIIRKAESLGLEIRNIGLQHLLYNAAKATLLLIVRSHISKTCGGEYDRHVFGGLIEWYNNTIFPWLKLLLRGISREACFLKESFEVLCKEFSNYRVHELFDIIVDFPGSLPAIEDLKFCLEYNGHRRLKLAEDLKEAHCVTLDSLPSSLNRTQRRLLHAGANTDDILTQYISTIRCLRILDPSHIALEIVAAPIRQYLKQREDTVRCIVLDMVSEESGLFEDLANGSPLSIDDDSDGDDDDDFDNPSWTPLPSDAKGVFSSARKRNVDVIKLLVSIFDTKDVFIKELERLLAKKILKSSGYNTDNEAKVLKLHFGSNLLQRCEVMLKDVSDSKRVNQYIKEQNKEFALDTTILSHQYWPPISSDDFQLPKELERIRTEYEKHFESLRPARKLEWKSNTGTVDLEVELGDELLTFSVAPLQASILFLFHEKDTLTIDNIAEALQCSPSIIKPRIQFWLGKGVLCEIEPGVYQTADTAKESKNSGGQVTNKDTGMASTMSGPIDDEDCDDGNNDDDGLIQSEADQKAEAMQVYWQFVVGMLTNLGALPLDRIHTMLGMFAQGTPPSVEDLRNFLNLMVREDKLEFSGGQYKLR
ncbi:Anaphase-promoting complex subunit 2 [Mycoemilia scoparia]|uniref:Anaphase-promoting complex subunit 2 n=1 Tax=Mycoemilia scoparia TaxID=417184 RepID=A0A9W8A9X5_9FUNG|nr:Anaphase-promoting complex subunit 2 [Mycoemilia scoparia]